jgi:hypothetical protein
MAEQEKRITQKKRGRPATGKGELIGVRLLPPLLDGLDAMIAQSKSPDDSRPEAIRRILTAHLKRRRMFD